MELLVLIIVILLVIQISNIQVKRKQLKPERIVINYLKAPPRKVEFTDEQVSNTLKKVDMRDCKCDLEAWRYISNTRKWPT